MVLSPEQTDATLLANNSQHCWMLHVASVCTPCCMLLDVVACCCAKFETDQTFQPTTPNISFVSWSPKRSATMLDLFAQLFQHCLGHVRSYAWFTKTYGFYPSHDALQVPILLGVVASVCTQPYHSNENSSVVHSRSTIHFVSSSNFWVYGGNPMVLPFKRNLFSSTFTWYYLFSM